MYPRSDERQRFENPTIVRTGRYMFCVYKTEPVIRLFSKLGNIAGDRKMPLIAILAFTLYFGVPAVLSFYEGTAFDNDPNKLAFFDDYFGIFCYAIIYPLLILAVIQYYESIPHAFHSLLDDGVIPSGAQRKYGDFISKLGNLYNERWISLVSGCLAIPLLIWYHKQFTAIGALIVYGGGGSGHLTLLGWYWLYVISGTVLYVLISTGMKHFVTMYATHKLCDDFALDVQVNHYDRCGGLGALGNIFINLAWVATLVGIMIASYTGLWAVTGFQYILLTYRWVLSSLMYLLLLPTFIFTPLWRLHRKMQRTKQERLIRINRNIQGEYKRIWDEKLLINVSADNVKKLDYLNQFYKLVDQTTVWPVNFGSARVIVPTTTALLSPLITSALKAALGFT